MNENLAVREMLYDKKTGRLIKAINQTDYSDYIDLATKNKEGKHYAYDLRPIIDRVHESIQKNLNEHQRKNDIIDHNSMYNNWTQLKSITNERLVEQLTAQIIESSEKTIQKTFNNLEIELSNFCLNNNSNNITHIASINIENNIDIFIESILCHIHSLTLCDMHYFRNDAILNGHVEGVITKLKSSLSRHLGIYGNNSLTHDSALYYYLLENPNGQINTEGLLSLIMPDVSKESILLQIFDKNNIGSSQDDYRIRLLNFTWTEVNNDHISKTITLAKCVQKLLPIQHLLNFLRHESVELDRSREATDELVSTLLKIKN